MHIDQLEQILEERDDKLFEEIEDTEDNLLKLIKDQQLAIEKLTDRINSLEETIQNSRTYNP